MNLLIVEDHRIVAEGVASLVRKRWPDYSIGLAFNLVEAQASLSSGREIDFVLCDLNIGGSLNGLSIIKQALELHKRAKVIVLSMYEDASLIQAALAKGAHAYLFKTDPPNCIEEAIDAVANGQKFLPKSVKDSLDKSGPLSRLTARQEEIAQMVSQGLTSKEIGVKLGLSHRTVDVHRKEIMKRLKVENAAQLVDAYLRRN